MAFRIDTSGTVYNEKPVTTNVTGFTVNPDPVNAPVTTTANAGGGGISLPKDKTGIIIGVAAVLVIIGLVLYWVKK